MDIICDICDKYEVCCQQGSGAERERRGLRLNPGHCHRSTFPSWSTCCHWHCWNHLCPQVPCMSNCAIIYFFGFFILPMNLSQMGASPGRRRRWREALHCWVLQVRGVLWLQGHLFCKPCNKRRKTASRDVWDVWLKAKTTKECQVSIEDLIPGSRCSYSSVS